MNTQEAIKFLNSSRMYVGYQDENNLSKIIDLLKRGEKHESIVKELKQYCLILERQNILKEIIRLEQKYFPKPKLKKDITIELEADNIKDMAIQMRYLGSFVSEASKMKIIDISKFKEDKYFPKGGSQC